MLLFAILSMLTVQSVYAVVLNGDDYVYVNAASSAATTCTDSSPEESDLTWGQEGQNIAGCTSVTTTKICCRSSSGVYTYLTCQGVWMSDTSGVYTCLYVVGAEVVD